MKNPMVDVKGRWVIGFNELSKRLDELSDDLDAAHRFLKKEIGVTEYQVFEYELYMRASV